MSVDVTLHPAGLGYRVSAGAYGEGVDPSFGTHWLTISSRDGHVDLHSMTPESIIELGNRIKAQGERLANGTS